MKKILTLTFLFVLTLTACGDRGDEPHSLRMTIASSQPTCNNNITGNDYKCFFVKMGNNTNWEVFSHRIEGFPYAAGYEYEVEVDSYYVKDRPQGTHPNRYIFRKIISSVEKTSEGMPSH